MNNFNQTSKAPIPAKPFRKKTIFIVILVIGLIVLSFASGNYVNKKVGEIYKETTDKNLAAANARLYTPAKQAQIEGSNNTWNVFGATNPKITIVEFGDFTCTYCHQNYPIVRSLMNKYSDSVKFIWRDRTPTQRSLVLALTAQCAGEQGKFWQMHDKLFEKQSATLGTDGAEIITLAQNINLDLDTFRSCLKKQTYLPKIKDSMKTGIDLNISGTPTFFINGTQYSGFTPEETFEAVIKELQ